MHVVVAGQGYVGLPLAVRAAEVGHQVVGFDVDQQGVRRLVPGRAVRPAALADGVDEDDLGDAGVAG